LTQSCIENWHKAVRDGIDNEGIRYLTVYLPALGKTLDQSLSTDHAVFHISPAIPAELYEIVWNPLTGRPLNPPFTEVQTEVVMALRQFLYLLYKLELPYHPIDEIKIIEGFVETDRGLPELTFQKDPVLRKARRFTTQVFQGFNPREIIPAHGPGAVATGEAIQEKGEFKRIYRALERFYPFTEYFMYSVSHVADAYDWLQSREYLEHGTAKVVLVPKDSRGPRLISCEPLEYQWIQQGLLRKMVAFLETHRSSAGFVNFTDQSVNQWLASLGSAQTVGKPSVASSSEYVTLDMKDASDRVSLSLVEQLFSGTELWHALMACRTPATKLPDGRVFGMKKFAPMGSAVCFPVEAWCFYVLALAVLSAHHCESMEDSVGRIYVYGDDIVCKREDYPLLLRYFPEVGLKFNEGKCCTGGFFRESCGVDAFAGTDVTPLKLRTVWSHRRSPDSLLSYVAYTNGFEARGYFRTASYLRKVIVSKYGPVPYASHECVAYVSFTGMTWMASVQENKKQGFKYRFNRNTQQLEILASVPHTKHVRSVSHSGWAEMLRSTLRPTGGPSGLHPVRRRVYLRRRWSVAYTM